MWRNVKCLYGFISRSISLTEPDQRGRIIHDDSATIWSHLERLCSILAVYVDHLCTLWLLVVSAILVAIPCIATILIAIRHISIGHFAHLLISY